MPFVILFENVPIVSVYNINNNNFKEWFWIIQYVT